jgi:hypothetical protein
MELGCGTLSARTLGQGVIFALETRAFNANIDWRGC